MRDEKNVTCPYCNETFIAFVDISQGNHQTIEDCYICCRPIEFLIESDGETLFRLETFTDDDSIY